MAFSTIFHSINSPDKSLLSHSVPLVLFPPFLVLSTIYLFMTVSPNESLPKWSRSGELWKQKLRSHLLRTQSLKVFPVKPGVGQYIATHATLTARDLFLANFYPSSLFCIFSQNLSGVFPVLALANTGSCVGLQNKTGHPAHSYN